MDRGAWRATVHGIPKSRTLLSDWVQRSAVSVGAFPVALWLRTLLQCGRHGFNPSQQNPLEEEMETQSSIFTGKVPWTEEHCGLQSMGWKRVRQEWACTHTCTVSVEFRIEPYLLVCGYYSPLESPPYSPIIFSIITHIISVNKSIFSVCIIIPCTH